MFDFHKRHTWRFILKSGATFDIKAKECSITYRTDTTEVTGYKLAGVQGQIIHHIVIGDISAILKVK